MIKHQRLERRNERIYRQFKKLFTEKGLRIEVIYKRLSDQFYLAPDTIEKIVLRQAKKKTSESGLVASNAL